MKKLMLIFLGMLVAGVTNAEPVWSTTNSRLDAVMVKYYYDNVSPVLLEVDKPWMLTVRSSDGVTVDLDWTGDEGDKPTAEELDAIDPEAAHNWYNGLLYAVRDNAASNIVALASTYGVTAQPVPWTTVALAMQAERADATASNDVMRLLTVIGDGTTMLSFKEFYTENGGDIFDVRWP